LSGVVFVCAHGAGGHKDDGAMLALDRTLTGIGLKVVRFNFPYRDKGRKIPDPMPVLKASIAEMAAGKGNVIIGGRSMGGRAASMLAADGFPCAGLLSTPSGWAARQVANRTPFKDCNTCVVLQRHARRALPPRPDGEARACRLGHAMAGRR
jgi:hypothetical protein